MADEFRFAPSLFAFLEALEANNERAWFNDNKHRYESEVRAPALAFVEAMATPLARIAPQFRASARRSGGSLMRVYRDTRFARDKTPYKTNVGIQFRHNQGSDVHAPGFYVHLDPRECFLGVGIWHPAPPALARIREFIADNPTAWRRARDARDFAARFHLAGDSLRRAPRGYPADHPLLEDLKRKDFIAIEELTREQVLAPDFLARTAGSFRTARPFMRYLCASLDVPY